MKITGRKSFAEMQWITKTKKIYNKHLLLNIVGGELRYPPEHPPEPPPENPNGLGLNPQKILRY